VSLLVVVSRSLKVSLTVTIPRKHFLSEQSSSTTDSDRWPIKRMPRTYREALVRAEYLYQSMIERPQNWGAAGQPQPMQIREDLFSLCDIHSTQLETPWRASCPSFLLSSLPLCLEPCHCLGVYGNGLWLYIMHRACCNLGITGKTFDLILVRL
jgi:hypothetical protein